MTEAWGRRRWGLVLLAAAMVLAGCGRPSGHLATRSSGLDASSPAPVPQSYPITTPVPQGQPGKMVADPTGDALWWWAVGEDRQARVYRFSTTDHRLTSWPLGGAEAGGLLSGIQYGIALAASGVVWVGANLKLVRLDTTTAAVKVIDVPPPPPRQPSQPTGPPQITGFHPIAGLAAGPAGQVALATAGSTAIPIYDPANHSFHQLGLPHGFVATDVAYLADGTLGVGLEPPTGQQENGAVLLVDPFGRTKLATGVEAGFLMPAGDRFLVGQVGLYWVYPDGTTKRGPAGIPGQEWIAYASSHPAWPLRDGDVAEVARGYDGLTDMANGRAARSITLPERPCPVGISGGFAGTPPGPGPTSSSISSTTTMPICHTQIGALAALGNTIWYLEDGQPLIWEVSGL